MSGAAAAEADPSDRRIDLRLVPAGLTCWAVTAAGILWHIGMVLTVVFGVTAALSALSARLSGRTERRTACTVVLAASLIGVGFGIAVTVRDNMIRDHPIGNSVGRERDVTVLVTESPRLLRGGRMLIRADLRLVGDGESRGRVVIFASARDYGAVAAGQSVRLRARIAAPTRRDLTVAVLTATGRPTIGRATAVQRGAHTLRAQVAAVARDVLPADQAALLPALVLGDTSAFPPTVVEQFQVAGLTHLTAVSGANVTIVCGAVLLSASFLGPRIAVALAAAVLVAFVVVVQPTPSVLRAAVMGAITLLAVVSARRRQAVPALAATVIGLLAVAPHLAVDIGFALSVSATAALVVLAPAWSRRLVRRGWPKPVADAVSVATAAQLVTAPLIAGISGSFSLVAIVANVAVVPVIAPITVLGTAAAAVCLLAPAAAALLIRFTGPELWWLLRVAQWAAGVPHASVPVPPGPAGAASVTAAAIVTVALTARLWDRRGFRIVMACLVMCLLAWSISTGITARPTVMSAGRGTMLE